MAEPTIAPSDWAAIFFACSGVEMPNPTAHGMSFAAFTSFTIAPISVVIWVLVPVTPREETQYTKPFASFAIRVIRSPLDLILSLLAKNKMEIQDIQISLILDQYMAWMNQRKRLDLEVASDFVSMAAQLVFIKSRMLLSIHDEEALSELEQLIATLQAHQRQEDYFRLRKVLPQLEEDFQRGRDYLTKTPEVLTPDRNVRYGQNITLYCLNTP